ncbi:hypothetical protein DUNSADRAFT_14061 [Dunaliella salina]|uniref:F-box domain-containing protein n=1 Tax=Dunaliella salina TaxID=3046 RepID=A0ABQ7G840_DUNSA|nr:hypothetical protein DUNSADRAFT_14061 [Dunaliella salina]|eukprot:KAF5830778.1 hypothetical protein DUNSADRAFT_14061 [Dunaliella salina]
MECDTSVAWTSFHALPEHLVAIIYSFLDSPSRHAFFASCRAVHSAPSVLAQITSLVIPPEQVDKGSSMPDCNPLPFFPSGARLSSLRIQGTFSLVGTAASRAQHDDGPQLRNLLQPAHKALRAKLQNVMHDVTELNLEGINLIADAPAAALSGLLCALCPNLKVLKLSKPGPASSSKASFLPASFLPPLANLRLMELHMAKNVNDVHALGQLESLQALSFSLPLSRSIPLAPLASLRSLKHLSICEDDSMPVGGSLADALAGLHMLEELRLPGLPAQRELHNLSRSLRTLVVNHVHTWIQMGDGEFRRMSELLSLASSSRFPMLRRIRIKDVDFSGGRNEQHTLPGVLQQASALLPPVHVTVDEVSGVDDLHPFFNVLHAHAEFARSIRAISFSGEKIEAGHLQHVAEHCPLLTSLRLDYGCLSDLGLRPLYEAVESLPFLQYLYFSMDAFERSVPALSVALLAFLVAAACQKSEAPHLHVELALIADADMDEAWTVEEKVDDLYTFFDRIRESWATARERLESIPKTRPVNLTLRSDL